MFFTNSAREYKSIVSRWTRSLLITLGIWGAFNLAVSTILYVVKGYNLSYYDTFMVRYSVRVLGFVVPHIK